MEIQKTKDTKIPALIEYIFHLGRTKRNKLTVKLYKMSEDDKYYREKLSRERR